MLTQHSFCYFETAKKKNPIASHPLSKVYTIYRRIDLKDHNYVMAIDMQERTHLWEFKTESTLREWLQVSSYRLIAPYPKELSPFLYYYEQNFAVKFAFQFRKTTK